MRGFLAPPFEIVLIDQARRRLSGMLIRHGQLRLLLQPIHDRVEEQLDGLGDVDVEQSTGFDVVDVILRGELLGTRLANDPVLVQIAFVPDENHVDVLRVGIRLDFTDPVANVEKRRFARQIEHEQKAHGVTEERRRQTAKSFLTGRVPETWKHRANLPAPSIEKAYHSCKWMLNDLLDLLDL